MADVYPEAQQLRSQFDDTHGGNHSPYDDDRPQRGLPYDINEEPTRGSIDLEAHPDLNEPPPDESPAEQYFGGDAGGVQEGQVAHGEQYSHSDEQREEGTRGQPAGAGERYCKAL